MNENLDNSTNEPVEKHHDILPVSGLYENWFLEYASYVILERAVPAIEDGMKPVQRRILHALNEMDDGRFNKVANIIGSTMQYHPHGDASIADAIVGLGQKDLLIETQGNWGDIRTGDGAAAPRYIEARLSKFAKEVLFNHKTTQWQLSYDGRKKEPITLPAKFPLLLAQGVEGIAVGLSTKVLPHNFCELIKASIAYLKGKNFELYPDFPTGGYIDVSNYNDGKRGGKIRVRAKIEATEKKTLLITAIPFGTTTTNLIESIIKANDSGKIKIKKITDNTAKDVEIEVVLQPGTSPDVTIDALYAFTDCEMSISTNACVIAKEKPQFLGVTELLKVSTEQTMELLRQELLILEKELLEKILFASLEQIFIQNRIYRKIEECETWEAVLQTIDKGLEPYKKDFYRAITQDDLVRLTEIKIKRISKYDSFQADELMRNLQNDLNETQNNLAHLRDYTILYFEQLLKKYGKGRERKTEIRQFDAIQATVVAANNQKLYIDRNGGFIGYGLKKDEYICDCSDLDEIIVIRQDGTAKVVKIDEKVFVGKDILFAGVFRRNDDRFVFNLVYLDGTSGITYVKRFKMGGVTRDREYSLTKGSKGSKVLYLSGNPNGEAEIIQIQLSNNCAARIKTIDFNFAELDIKGRDAQGNILTKYPVKKVKFKVAGESTLGGLEIWYDESTGKLNTDERGKFVGKFSGNDKIIVFYRTGEYELTNYELTNRYEFEKILSLQKFNPESVVAAIYQDGASKSYFLKRFLIETSTLDKKFNFITEHKQSFLAAVTTSSDAQAEIWVRKDKKEKPASQILDIDIMAEVKGWKAIGTKLSSFEITKVSILENSNSEKEKEQLKMF
jgi:topoisomerase-4 subunit A